MTKNDICRWAFVATILNLLVIIQTGVKWLRTKLILRSAPDGQFALSIIFINEVALQKITTEQKKTTFKNECKLL